MAHSKPLVLDVDGTLLKTDLSYESFWSALSQAPLATLAACFAHLGKPAPLKRALASLGPLETERLPVNPVVAEIAEAALEGGSAVVLCTSGPVEAVAELAAVNGLGDQVFGSDGAVNLKGKAKAAVLIEAFGRDGYHFAGSRGGDRPVFEAADGVILVGRHGALAEDLKQEGKEVSEIASGWRGLDLFKTLRLHHWPKSLLLLLPLLSAQIWPQESLLSLAGSMLVFALASSFAYLINDLLDLSPDRQHPRKQKRAFASGAVPIKIGMRSATILLIAALCGAAALGWQFAVVLVSFVALSLAYGLGLKRLAWVDLFVLAALNLLRVIGGAVAAGLALSTHLLIWLLPIFVMLAASKRLSEFGELGEGASLPGRGYHAEDAQNLRNFAWLGAVAALIAFFAYSFTANGLALYPEQWMLWLALLPMALWLRRIITLGTTAQHERDPLLTALVDLPALALMLITFGTVYGAAGIWQRLFGV